MADGGATRVDPRDADGARDGDRFERTERLTAPHGRGPSGPVAAVAGVVVIVLALLKPWASPEPPVVATIAPTLPDLASASVEAVATPIPVPTAPSAETAARGLCFGIAEWRVVAAEIWSKQPVRAWIAADARVAHDPLDPNIAFTPVVATAVPALGFCAPVDGDDRPPDDAAVALWRLDPTGPTTLRPRIREPAVATPFGRLWWPVAKPGEDPATWPPGRYVVGIAGSAGYVRFVGMEVVLTPPR